MSLFIIRRTKVRINEREISSLLDYFSQRVKVPSPFVAKVRINEQEISSLLDYFSQRVRVSSWFSIKVQNLFARLLDNI